MSTPISKVYDAFLARITADDWTRQEDRAIVEQDWFQLLNMAIYRFRFPRVEIEFEPYDEESEELPLSFTQELSNDEIQLLALYMKHEWVKRCVASWENIRMLYADNDFSQANHLDKLNKLQAAVAEEIWHAEGLYDRVWKKKPSKRFSQLAGKNHG